MTSARSLPVRLDLVRRRAGVKQKREYSFTVTGMTRDDKHSLCPVDVKWWSGCKKSPKNVENPQLVVKKMIFVCPVNAET